jgi:hypothetical protein
MNSVLLYKPLRVSSPIFLQLLQRRSRSGLYVRPRTRSRFLRRFRYYFYASRQMRTLLQVCEAYFATVFAAAFLVFCLYYGTHFPASNSDCVTLSDKCELYFGVKRSLFCDSLCLYGTHFLRYLGLLRKVNYFANSTLRSLVLLCPRSIAPAV